MDVVRTMLRVENGFDAMKVRDFAANYWHWSIYISAFYVVSIFSLQYWMKNRKEYDLRRPLFAWSLALAIFSIYGYSVVGVAHMSYFFSQGWERSICDNILVDHRKGLWAFLFCFSKLPELFDTYFIILRKKKLIFLHWYHHITVFIYCWFHYCHMINPAQWFITMNYFVHSIMYLYFAIRAAGIFRPPVWVNMVITSLQLLQMVVGMYLNIFLYRNMADKSWYCDGEVETTHFYVYISFAMYFSYMILFADFFYNTYMRKSNKKQEAIGAHIQENGVGSHSKVQAGMMNGVSHMGNGTVVQNRSRHR